MGTPGRLLVRALTWPLAPAFVGLMVAIQLRQPVPTSPLLAPGDVPFVVSARDLPEADDLSDVTA